MRRLAYLTIAFMAAGCASAPARPASHSAKLSEQRSPAALFAQGQALARRGDYVRAEQYFMASVARGVPKEQALPHLIRVCVRSERLRAALAHASPFLQRNPDRWHLRFVTATLHLGLEEPERAARELDEVVRQRPDFAPAHYLLGVVHRDYLQNESNASRGFAGYVALAPSGPHAAESEAWLRDHPLEAAPARETPERSQP